MRVQSFVLPIVLPCVVFSALVSASFADKIIGRKKEIKHQFRNAALASAGKMSVPDVSNTRSSRTTDDIGEEVNSRYRQATKSTASSKKSKAVAPQVSSSSSAAQDIQKHRIIDHIRSQRRKKDESGKVRTVAEIMKMANEIKMPEGHHHGGPVGKSLHEVLTVYPVETYDKAAHGKQAYTSRVNYLHSHLTAMQGASDTEKTDTLKRLRQADTSYRLRYRERMGSKSGSSVHHS